MRLARLPVFLQPEGIDAGRLQPRVVVQQIQLRFIPVDQALQRGQKNEGVIITQQILVGFTGRGRTIGLTEARLARQRQAMFVMIEVQIADVEDVEAVGGWRLERGASEQ